MTPPRKCICKHNEYHCFHLERGTVGRVFTDDDLGFHLVPWRPALEKELGREVGGVMDSFGRVDWDFGRKRGLGL